MSVFIFWGIYALYCYEVTVFLEIFVLIGNLPGGRAYNTRTYDGQIQGDITETKV